MKPLETIRKFDQYLKAQSLSFKGVIIGDSALSILGVITRETQDCDVLDPNIPESIQEAAKSFAKEQCLEHDWLNNGPESLKRDLPKGWRLRLQNLFEGEAQSWVSKQDANPDWPKHVEEMFKNILDQLSKRQK